jgi:tetratricopeptide (TPR) repeat protein/transcriptional regulator with XRE-family HTH domain
MAKKSFQVDPEKLEKVKRAFDAKGCTQQELAEEVDLRTRQPIGKFLSGKPVERKYFQEICFKLGILDWKEVAYLPKNIKSEPEEKEQSNALSHDVETDTVEKALEIGSELDALGQQLRSQRDPAGLGLAEILRIIQGIERNKQNTFSSANLICVPPTLENWQGRNQEIQILQGWLADAKVKTIGIQGLSGVGKSWLATYLYESIGFELKFWADVRQGTDFTVFAQNALMQLTGKSPEDLVALREPDQLMFALLSSLRQHPCLLVVDNLETLLDRERHFIGTYRDFFNRWIEHGSGSTLVLTTQTQPEVMEGHGCWLPLQGLEATDGAQLVQELGVVGSEEELQHFARYLNGHPKMLRLVASKLKPGTHIREAEKLGFSQLDLLLNKVPMLYRDREKVLFVSILEQHFEELTPELQHFFLNLSLYRRSFDRDAALVLMEAKEQASAWETQQALEELVSHSLLEEVQGERRCYEFHPFVLQYAKQKAGNQQDLLHRKSIAYKSIAYYLSIAPDRSIWNTLEDVTPYLEIFYIQCELEQYPQAFDTLNTCSDFLELQGYNAIKAELCRWLIQFWIPTQEEKSEFGSVLTLIANAYQHLGQNQRAVEYHQQALEIAKQIGDSQGETISLSNLGCAYDALEKYDQAIKYHQQSLKIAEKIGDHKGQAVSLGGVGNVYQSLGKYEQAIKYHQQSLEIKQQIGDIRGQAASLNGLGLAYQGLGQYQQAIHCYQMSWEFDRQVGNLQGEATVSSNVGNVYHILKNYQQAIECYQQSLKIARQIRNAHTEASSLRNLGNAYFTQGQYQQAIGFYQHSLKITRDLGDRQGKWGSLNGLGNSYSALGQHKQAIECHQQSLEIARDIGAYAEESVSLGNLADVYGSLEQYQQAIEYAQKSLEISQRLGACREQEAALGRLGNSYSALGQHKQAIELYQQSLKIAREIGDCRGEALSLNGLGDSYSALGQHEQGIELYQQSLKIAREIGDRRGEIFCLLGLGNSYGALEQHQEAFESYEHSLEIARDIGERRVEATALFNLGVILANLSRKSEATTVFQNARFLYQAMGLDNYVKLVNDVIQEIS